MGKHQRYNPNHTPKLSIPEINHKLKYRKAWFNGKETNLLDMYGDFMNEGIFKNEHFKHTKEQFYKRVYTYDGKIDFNQTSLCTINNNLHDEPQKANIMHSLTINKNIVFAVTADEEKKCKTIMTDMCDDTLNGFKMKLAAEFLEFAYDLDIGRSSDKIEKTIYDSFENYCLALTTLGFTSLSPCGVYDEYIRLKNEPKSKHIQDVCRKKNHKAQKY